MKVYLNKETRKYEKEIKEYLDHQIAYNCNLNGAEYEIEYDDFTWIDLDNDIGIFLINGINSIIENE